MKKIILVLLILSFLLVGCNITLTPTVHIGFKQHGNAGEYDESIQELAVGEVFYCALKLKMTTDKKSPREYTVVIDLPKTKDVEINRDAGLRDVSSTTDADSTTLTFKIQGYKEATEQLIHFTGCPYDEGKAVIVIMIYDEEGLAVNAGYDKTVYFVYE